MSWGHDEWSGGDAAAPSFKTEVHSGEDTTNNNACFTCGEQGHRKSECPSAPVRACFSCGQEGHTKADCPDPKPMLCNNCGEEGHGRAQCSNARLLNRDHVESVSAEEAWAKIAHAVKEREVDEVEEAIEMLLKSSPTLTFNDIEASFRSKSLGVWLIAIEKPLSFAWSNMDLQGNLGKKFSATIRFSATPGRGTERNLWPESAAENIERLKDAGYPVESHTVKCRNCEELGHTSKACPEPKSEPAERLITQCTNCEEVGHRVRDCPQPRKSKFACRNCGQDGHSSRDCTEPRSAAGVDCKKCGETGHFARDCPQGGSGEMTCRNCDAPGHMSRECPEPRDWSRVKCSNCSQMGHGRARCPEPLADEPAPVNDDAPPLETDLMDMNEAANAGDGSGGWEASADSFGGGGGW